MNQPTPSTEPAFPFLNLDHDFMKGLRASEIIPYAKQQLGLDLGSRVIVLASVNEEETAPVNGEIIAFSVGNEAPSGWAPTLYLTAKLDGYDRTHQDSYDGFVPIPGPGRTPIQ